MDIVNSGPREDGYIYGYIFLSRYSVILDTGSEEHPLEGVSFDIWNGFEFVEGHIEDIEIPDMLGTKARIRKGGGKQ